MIRRTSAALAAVAGVLSACGGGSGHPVAGSGHMTPSTRSASMAVASGSATSRLAVTTQLHLPVGVSRTVVVAQGNDLLVLGGLAPGDTTTSRVWRVSPLTKHVTRATPLRIAVHDASGVTLGGHAYVFGGGSAATVATVQQWAAGQVAVVGSLPQPRSDSAAAVVGSTAYVVGGFSGRGMTRDVLATTNGRTFRVVGRLAIGVRYPAVAAVGGAVYVVGGALATTEGTANGGQTAAVQRFDPSTGKVRVIGSLPSPLAHATAFALGGALFVAGGRHGATATSTIDRIDLHSGKATRVGALPRRMSDAAVAVIGGVAWLVGGETAGPGAPVDTVLRLRLA